MHNYFFVDGGNVFYLKSDFQAEDSRSGALASDGAYGAGAPLQIVAAASLSDADSSVVSSVSGSAYFYDWDHGLAHGQEYTLGGEDVCPTEYNSGGGECWRCYWLVYNDELDPGNSSWHMSTSASYDPLVTYATFKTARVVVVGLRVIGSPSGGLAELRDAQLVSMGDVLNAATLATFADYSAEVSPEYTSYAVANISNCRGDWTTRVCDTLWDIYNYFAGTYHTCDPAHPDASLPANQTHHYASNHADITYSWSLSGDGADHISFAPSTQLLEYVSAPNAATPVGHPLLYYRTPCTTGDKEATLTLTVVYPDGVSQTATSTITVRQFFAAPDAIALVGSVEILEGQSATPEFVFSRAGYSSLLDERYELSFAGSELAIDDATRHTVTAVTPGVHSVTVTSLADPNVSLVFTVTVRPLAPAIAFEHYTDATANTTVSNLSSATSPAIYYTVDGTTPTAASTSYTAAFYTSQNTVVKAIVVAGGVTSDVVEAANPYSNASGDSPSSPFTIGSAVDLAYVAAHTDYYFILVDDIDASTLDASLATFTGTLDGNYHKINNLTVPLFATVDGGTVRNLVLDDVDITATGNVGAICGHATGAARIYNCGVTNSASRVQGGTNVGSLVGQLSGTARVVNCYSFASVSGSGYVGGLVGYNSGTAPTTYNPDASAITTMVMNCMFYGDVASTASGAHTSPIYGGNHIRSDYLTNYNYYHADSLKGTVTDYNSALAVDDFFLTRIEFYRHTINNNRHLVAWYISGNTQDTALVGKWVFRPGVDVLPVVRRWGKYPSLVNHATEDAITVLDPDPAVPDNKYVGKTLGHLTVTVNHGNGSTVSPITITLNITDMDTAKHDYNYYKVQLPYYNDFRGVDGWNDNYQRNPGRVVTGWKITAVTASPNITYNNFSTLDYSTDYDGYTDFVGGTNGSVGPTSVNPDGYNFADRYCWQKDVFGYSGRVFAQGGYYNVPEGVTAITIEAYWGNAIYVGEQYYDRIYRKSGNNTAASADDFTAPGPNPATRDYSNLLDAAASTDNGFGMGTVYDNAIVLVGNWSRFRYTPYSGNNAFTIMSIDEDGDNEPDYGYYANFYNRQNLSPMRFDFVNNPGFMTRRYYQGVFKGANGIPHPKGHFEITETSNGFYNQIEYGDCNSKSQDNLGACTRTDFVPLILNGGYTVHLSSQRRSKYPIRVRYIILGGNYYARYWTPGNHTDDKEATWHAPVSVLGGEYVEFYHTGKTADARATDHPDKAIVHSNGGYIHTYAASYSEQLANDVITHFDHTIFDEYYGGSTSVSKPQLGNISNHLSNCLVGFFCGGPKFGNMQTGKVVSTAADRCVFGDFFGAGYGGTALSGQWQFNLGVKSGYTNTTGDVTKLLEKAVTEIFKNDTRLVNNSEYGGYLVSYLFDWFWASNDDGGCMAWGYFYYASLSVAETRGVTSTLTDCYFKRDFYGGGSLGRVGGDVTTTLKRCRVEGNAYGGGFSVTVPNVTVYNIDGYTMPTYNTSTGVFTPMKYPETETYTWEQGATAVDNVNHTIPTSEDFSTLGAVQGSTTLILDDSEVKGSVFGGGNESKVTGNTNVTVKGSTLVKGSVFGGGNKAEVGTDTENTTKVYLLGNCRVDGNVYGGGNQGNTKGNTKVYIGGTD